MQALTSNKVKYKSKNKNNKTLNIKKSEQFFKTSIVLSIITPLVYLLYMYLQSVNTGTDIYSVIFLNPTNTVIFIISMIQPFCAYMIKNAISDIKEGKNYSISQLTIYIMFASQIVLGNLITGVCVGLGIYKTQNKDKEVLKKSVEELKDNNVKVKIIGCALILISCILCSYINLFRI